MWPVLILPIRSYIIFYLIVYHDRLEEELHAHMWLINQMSLLKIWVLTTQNLCNKEFQRHIFLHH